MIRKNKDWTVDLAEAMQKPGNFSSPITLCQDPVSLPAWGWASTHVYALTCRGPTTEAVEAWETRPWVKDGHLYIGISIVMSIPPKTLDGFGKSHRSKWMMTGVSPWLRKTLHISPLQWDSERSLWWPFTHILHTVDGWEIPKTTQRMAEILQILG